MGYGIDGYTISENECSFIKTENWDELDVLLEANKSHWLDTNISYSNAGAMNEICDMC